MSVLRMYRIQAILRRSKTLRLHCGVSCAHCLFATLYWRRVPLWGYCRCFAMVGGGGARSYLRDLTTLAGEEAMRRGCTMRNAVMAPPCVPPAYPWHSLGIASDVRARKWINLKHPPPRACRISSCARIGLLKIAKPKSPFRLSARSHRSRHAPRPPRGRAARTPPCTSSLTHRACAPSPST